MNRKTFIRNSSLATAGLFAGDFSKAFSSRNADKIRIGMLGVGLRGQDHLELLLNRDDVIVTAICDVDGRMLDMAKQVVQKSGKQMPKIYTGNDNSWKDLLAKEKLDGVVIVTPWEWHNPMILGALDAGIKYVASEVILGITLQDHWNLIHACEKHQAHVMMLENVCYRRDVMAALNMVRQGLFGEIIHLQGGYQHNLRPVKFNDGVHPYDHGIEFGPKAFSEARWRTEHSVKRNADLYPTHGIGPIARYIDINFGNRFVSLNSFASKARGLHSYILEQGGANHPNAKVNFKLGDVVTTQISCANGETVLLQHDTSLPRPYSLGFRVQGTKGLWMDVNHSIYIDGKSPKNDQWEDEQKWFDEYDHPLWKRWSKETSGAGHGGMDFFVIHGFIESIKRNQPTPIDVYDSVTWSAITPLSEQSIANNNSTMAFPDFTSGRWQNRKTNFALTDEF